MERLSFLRFCPQSLLYMSLYLLFLVLCGLEILDDLIEVILAFVDLDAHVESLAFFLLNQDSLCYLIGLH